MIDPISLCELTRQIRLCIIEQEGALAEDDPADKCAAFHRGAIWAFLRVLNIIEALRQGDGIRHPEKDSPDD